MTRVEESLEHERPASEELPRLGVQVCPACRAEAEVGQPLPHTEGCPRRRSAGESEPPAK